MLGAKILGEPWRLCGDHVSLTVKKKDSGATM